LFIVSFAVTTAIWLGLSLVVISFYALSLLFGPCCLSEFTLAGPLKEKVKLQVFKTASQNINPFPLNSL